LIQYCRKGIVLWGKFVWVVLRGFYSVKVQWVMFTRDRSFDVWAGSVIYRLSAWSTEKPKYAGGYRVCSFSVFQGLVTQLHILYRLHSRKDRRSRG
jgi:hypothetical protein